MQHTFINRLRIIHAALCGSCILFGAIDFMMYRQQGQMDTSFSNPLSIVGISLGLLIVISTFLYTRRVKEIPETASLEEKKLKYQHAYIIMLALIQGATLFNIVVYQITFNTFHLILAGAFVANMLSKMPNKTHISQLLNCSPDEL